LLLERVQACLDESQLAQRELDRLRSVKVRLGQLTTREREVLDFLMQGKPSKLIASEMGISPKTVDVHRARVMEKIGIKSLAELIRLVVRLEQRGEF
jgi:two-component system response regulator TtrR